MQKSHSASKKKSQAHKKTSKHTPLQVIAGEEGLDPKNASVQQARAAEERPFSPGELSIPPSDEEQIPDPANPPRVQGGRGPLGQEGEGNRQNDELAELQQDVENPMDKERA